MLGAYKMAEGKCGFGNTIVCLALILRFSVAMKAVGQRGMEGWREGGGGSWKEMDRDGGQGVGVKGVRERGREAGGFSWQEGSHRKGEG